MEFLERTVHVLSNYFSIHDSQYIYIYCVLAFFSPLELFFASFDRPSQDFQGSEVFPINGKQGKHV